MKNAVVETLRKAAAGLLYESETEAGLEPFLWPEKGDLTVAHVLKEAGAPVGTAVEVATLADFFRAVSQEDRPAFDKLAKVLGEQLANVKVYKIGDEPEKQAYVVGKTSDGQWAGLKTTVVET